MKFSDKRKPIILVFNKHYLPGYKSGGPVRTISNMVERLGNDFQFYIITLDRDIDEGSTYKDVVRNTWIDVGKARVMYLSKKQVTLFSLKSILMKLSPDAIYLNSFFDPIFTQRILMLRRMFVFNNLPFVLAPRGEFSVGALNIKRTKKRLYLNVAEMLRIYHGVLWQASTLNERNDICRAIPNLDAKDIHVASDLAELNGLGCDEISIHDESDSLKLCFLSRICAMKNLDYALLTLSYVRAKVTFTIYGPKEDIAYWELCERLIRSLPDNIKVEYKGEVPPDMVKKTLAQYDLLFLPTRGENFGHVIHEAFCAGLPVLVSDQTPWRKLKEKEVGWDLSLENMALFARTIDSFAGLSQEEVYKLRVNACHYGVEKANDDVALNANKLLFSEAIKRSVN